MGRFSQLIEQLQGHAQQLCMEGDGFSYTYSQLLDEVKRWQPYLDALNIGPGNVIGLRADYSLSAVAALLSLFARNAVVALIPRDRDSNRYLVGAHAVGLIDLKTDGTYQWHDVPPPPSHPLLERLLRTGDAGIIMFTSGSTGQPKAALQSLERFLYKFRTRGRRFRTLAFLLFDHVGGLDTLFHTLCSGGTIIVTRRRDPESVLGIIESYRVEVLPTSPTFLRLLCAAGETSTHDLSSLKIIAYGSEPMDSSTLARVNARFPDTQIRQKYGTTETGSPRSISRGNDSLWLKIESDSVESKVVNGILWIRTEGTMLGYLNAASAVDEDGWYCTGDLVEVDGEWIKFRGRAADTINVGGEKVAPTEVEQSILELEFVRDVLVSGEPHVLMGQIVTARVVLVTGVLDPKEAIKRIRLHCREHLVSYKVPVRIEIVAEGLASERQKMKRSRPTIGS